MVFVLFISLSVCLGCIGEDIENLPIGKKKAKPTKDVGALVDDFSVDDYTTHDNLLEIVDQGEAAIPALKKELKSEEPGRRWLATQGISWIGFELSQDKRDELIPTLKESFDDSDPRIRQISAGAAAGLGDKSGLPILIEYLDNEEATYYIDPPEPMYHYSIVVLRHYTSQNFGYDEDAPMEDRAQAIGKWWEWWNNNGDRLVYVPGPSDTGRYTVK